MRIVADFHVHSKYARATSPQCEPDGLAEGAKIKGINVMATGDFTHPQYFQELKQKLPVEENGLFPHNGIHLILSVEISLIYSGKKHANRMHHLVLAPNFEVASQINDILGKRGNLRSDGRPILGIRSPEFAELLFEISKDIVIIPAHCWTPWFGIFGSAGGVDTVKEAFEDQAKNIFALETGLSCYDSETEVLTENGWKKFSDVLYSERVCTLNPETYEVEFQNPTKISKYQYKGDMYRLKTKRVDLFVTPNHNLFYRQCDFRTIKSYRLAESKELFGKSKIFKKDGIWNGRKEDYFMLPEVQLNHGSRYYSGTRKKAHKFLPIQSWLKFFGFWIAEGWVTEGKDGDYNICVCNNNPDILDEMKAILESFGYSTYKGKNIIRVRDFQLFNYLKQFGKASQKFIPRDIKSLSKELLEMLFEYYIKGDGHRYGRNRKGLSATTISTRLRDDLQEIALKLGMSAYYKLHKKKGTPFNSPSQKKQYFQTADSWVIFFIRKNEHTVIPSTIKKYNYIEKWEKYDGFVYCLSVPNHVLYVRRNGIPVWCGNSDPSMNWMLSSLDKYTLVSNSDAHSIDKLGREANVFDLEELSYNSLIRALRTKKGFVKTYEFYPEEGKYHYDGHRNCKVILHPQETKKYKGLCPVCKKPLTIGVLNRVYELADRPEGFKLENAVPFQRIVPLKTVIAKATGKSQTSIGVQHYYSKLITYFGNEFAVYEATEEQLRLATEKEIADALIRVNKGEIKWIPGFDGVFGELILHEKKSGKTTADKKQRTLGEF